MRKRIQIGRGGPERVERASDACPAQELGIDQGTARNARPNVPEPLTLQIVVWQPLAANVLVLQYLGEQAIERPVMIAESAEMNVRGRVIERARRIATQRHQYQSRRA